MEESERGWGRGKSPVPGWALKVVLGEERERERTNVRENRRRSVAVEVAVGVCQCASCANNEWVVVVSCNWEVRLMAGSVGSFLGGGERDSATDWVRWSHTTKGSTGYRGPIDWSNL